MIRFDPKPANPMHGYEADAFTEARLRFVDHLADKVEVADPEPM
jgi:hypothetical protein